MAICSAIELAKSAVLNKIIIATDSKSTLMAILNYFNNEPIIVNIRDGLLMSDKIIKLLWIPSHKGIEGNEEADRQALIATSCSSLEKTVALSDSLSDVKQEVKRRWNDFRETIWENSKYHLLKMKAHPFSVKSDLSLTVREQLVVTCLRLGHTYATHSYKINKREEPELCGELLTVTHIIFDCTHIQHQRRKLGTTWNEVLGYEADLKSLISFLKAVNYFNII